VKTSLQMTTRNIQSYFGKVEEKKVIPILHALLNCEFCTQKFTSTQGLGNHVKQKHNTSCCQNSRLREEEEKKIAKAEMVTLMYCGVYTSICLLTCKIWYTGIRQA